jgi:hypothetical protein
VISRALAITCALAAAAAAGPYTRDARVAHLDRALAALRALGGGSSAFERELHDATRAKCSATAPTTVCARERARAICATKPDRTTCLAAADIVITNQHAANGLVDELTRVKLVRSSTDYHAALAAELHAIYALLAAEFALAEPGPDAALAARIDRFCATRDREVHRCAPGVRTCVPSVPYQRCAAALVWYIAEAKR